jgi:hypothetical protein
VDKDVDGLGSIASLHSREKHPSAQLLDDQFELGSNPLHWTQEDVYQYLMKTDDCADVAQKCKDEVQYIVKDAFNIIEQRFQTWIALQFVIRTIFIPPTIFL